VEGWATAAEPFFVANTAAGFIIATSVIQNHADYAVPLARGLLKVKECNEKMAYTYRNPVKAALVKKPEDWKWSGVHDYIATVNAPSGKGNPVSVDGVMMPGDER
jgi:hypothetical protein